MTSERPLHDIYSNKSGIPGLMDFLTNARLSYISPILLKVMADRCKSIAFTELLETYDSKRLFFGPSPVSQRDLLEFILLFYHALPINYLGIEVSPILPLGLNSVITQVSQNNILSTIRGSEVVSDSTTPLIVECASRRKKLARNKTTLFSGVHLATCVRVLRMQTFDQSKGFSQHFQLFGLASAGRSATTDSFTIGAIVEHISIWLNFIDILNMNSFSLSDISVNISSIQLLEWIIKRHQIPREIVTKNSLNEEFDLFHEYNVPLPQIVMSSDHDNLGHEPFIVHKIKELEDQFVTDLRNRFPKVRICLDLSRKSGLGYYRDVCFHIYAKNNGGKEMQLADGGSVDWTAKLLSDNKELAVTSGFGAELIFKLFKTNI